ncbi:transposon Ty3-I Gag-Pol polyprotein [Trichonephila clavipes]|nr:transposon Ty3-I Gag-Pol polyprotein [Trichonephila clavipes]
MTGYARDFTGRECTEMSFGMSCIVGSSVPQRPPGRLVPIPAIAPFHRIGIDLLGRFPKAEKNWDEILPFVTFAYNTAKQETTGFTPFYLLHGREAETTLDTMLPFCPNDFDDNNITKIAARAEESRQLARVHTLRAQDKDRRRYDSKHQMVSYAPGDLVWVYTPVRKVGLSEKLLRRYFGPYQVLRRLSAVTYEVQDFDPASRKEN